MHDENSFLTLTYDDAHYPEDGSVQPRSLQLFMKRLRKAISPQKVRYYACGEYGEENWRAHYHVLLFGFGFPDRTPWRKSDTGFQVYRSAFLERLWADADGRPLGHAELGTVTAQSGSYVARYVLKKIGGNAAADHYFRPNPVTGVMCQLQPEFALMSSRPGIGGKWFDRYEGDAFPSDFLVVDAAKVPVPKYFLEKLKGRNVDKSRLTQPDDATPIQAKRRLAARDPHQVWNRSKERLAVREEVTEARISKLKRPMEQ